MPTYEYRCQNCGRKVTLTNKTYAEYDTATPVCPHCGSADLKRLISRVAIKRSTLSQMAAGGWDDDDALSALDSSDPATLGRMLREMGSEVGDDLGGEFEEVVERLERGESPEEIEASLPPTPGDEPLPPATPSAASDTPTPDAD